MAKGCGHCGFPGELEHKGNTVVETSSDDVRDYGEIEWTRYWSLKRCPACREPTLSEIWWSDDVSSPDEEPTAIYPTPRDNSAVPENVSEKYDRALKVKKVDPGLYAVGIRRMLEAVCNDKGVRTGDLFDRIDALAENRAIPGTLQAQAQRLRRLGNLGAHDKDIDVEEADVPIIEDFAEAILEYLYRAPAKLDALEASLAARNAGARTDDSSNIAQAQ
jgi:hypothetical protein